MSNMADLKQRLHQQLRDKHSERVSNDANAEELLGIDDREGSILDPENEYWDEYDKDIDTQSDVDREIKFALLSLNDDGAYSVLGVEDTFLKVRKPGAVGRQVCPSCGGGPFKDTYTTVMETHRSPSLVVSFTCAECDEAHEYHTNVIER